MTDSAPSLELTNLEPTAADMTVQVVEGLSKTQKTMPSSFFYDEAGSALFDEICRVPEYYPTRTELAIMEASLPEMTRVIGPEAMVIEYGSGTGLKTRGLLSALEHPVAYVPVEISREFLMVSAEALQAEFRNLEVLPVCADFTEPFEVPQPSKPAQRRALYFPGSTIGNFRPEFATKLLRQMREEVGSGGCGLLGVDLVKDSTTLEAAYNDAAGVTAKFNLNMLRRSNDELGADFDLDAFGHRAVWVEERSAIEMRLYARRPTAVNVGGKRFTFREGEWIHTEDSHKYTLEAFAALANEAGFDVDRVWTDDKKLFSVQYLLAR
ncbi:MAG: L-histidine N(alpha)-methyltransferase [Nannocystaceae bacterium]|nr:L-histidine N(alpha)-methyltransferase [Nannocystaceae bacterium]